MKADLHKRLVAVKTADAINAIKGVPVSADAKLRSEKWVRGGSTGEQMKQELLALHRKIAAEEKSERSLRPMTETGSISLTDV